MDIKLLFDDLTPVERGILAAALVDCRELGDEAAIDALSWNIVDDLALPADPAEELAYFVVHARKRSVESRQ